MRTGEVNPLDPETFRKLFSSQLQTFQKLFCEEMRHYGKPWPQKSLSVNDVLSFVESLMLCPTEESALIRILQDRESAHIVYILAGDIGREFDAKYAQALIQATHDQTPFFAVMCAVWVKLKATIAEHPHYRF